MIVEGSRDKNLLGDGLVGFHPNNTGGWLSFSGSGDLQRKPATMRVASLSHDGNPKVCVSRILGSNKSTGTRLLEIQTIARGRDGWSWRDAAERQNRAIEVGFGVDHERKENQSVDNSYHASFHATLINLHTSPSSYSKLLFSTLQLCYFIYLVTSIKKRYNLSFQI